MAVVLRVAEVRKILAGLPSDILALSFRPADDEDLWIFVHHRDHGDPGARTLADRAPVARLAVNARVALGAGEAGAVPPPERLSEEEIWRVVEYYREFIVTILRGDAEARERTVLAPDVTLVD